jgi:hypothetical protein
MIRPISKVCPVLCYKESQTGGSYKCLCTCLHVQVLTLRYDTKSILKVRVNETCSSFAAVVWTQGIPGHYLVNF